MARVIGASLALAAAPLHGEGPWWDARGGLLLWVDMVGKRIHKSDPSRGTDVAIPMPEIVGAVVGRERGGIAVLLESGFAAVLDDGRVSWLSLLTADGAKSRFRFNDGKCDSAGRFLGGTRSYTQEPGADALFQLDATHSVRRLVTGLTTSNGLAWAADGRTMYLVDSGARSIRVYGYDHDSGNVTSERRVIDVPSEHGVPDGMTIDADGCLWVATYGSGCVRRYTPDGRLDTTVTLPVTGVTSCAFGGADFADLYVTTSPYSLNESERAAQPEAGCVFVCRPGVSGRPEPYFAG